MKKRASQSGKAAPQEQEVAVLEGLEEPRAGLAPGREDVDQLQGILVAERVFPLAARGAQDLQHRGTGQGTRLTG
jgi:hypothetical protein